MPELNYQQWQFVYRFVKTAGDFYGSCQLDTNGDILENRVLQVRNRFYQINLWECVWRIPSMSDQCGRTHYTEDATTPGLYQKGR